MKIVMTTVTPDIESEVDPRFGRGAYLLLIDTATLDWQAYPNPGVTASGGAGIQVAQFITEHQAEAVVSGDFGPHAFEALNAASLPMYVFGNCRTVREAMAQFQAGQLQRIGTATRSDGHSEGQG